MFVSKHKKQIKKYKKQIKRSTLFDDKYYLKLNRDARLFSSTPLDHFIQIGLKEDRKPNEKFDPIWYREFYQDVKEDGAYPFIHFIQYGLKENRFQNEEEKKEYENLKDGFDIDFYKNSYDDLKLQNEEFDFLLHYVRYGKYENRQYRFKYPLEKDTAKKFKYQLEHIDTSGIRGWVYPLDKNEYKNELKLIVIIDDKIKLESYVNIDREDLKRKFGIKCYAGYHLEVPKQLKDEKKHNIKIFIVNNQKYYLLHKTDVIIEQKVTISQPKQDTKNLEFLVESQVKYINNYSSYFKHNVEDVSISGIKGWVYNLQKNSSDDVVRLKFIIDDKEVILAKTTIDRADIKRVFNVNCKAGYQVNIPLQYLDGRKHNLKIIAQLDNKEYLLKEMFFSEKSKWIYEKQASEKVVLFCSHNLRSQGAQNSLFELAIGLRRLFNITPIVYSPSTGPLEEKYKDQDIRVIVDNSFNVQCQTIDDWENELKVLEMKLSQLNPDVVIANTLLSFYMVHGAYRLSIPTIFIPRESEPPKSYFDYLPDIVRKEAYSTMIKASQVVFVANATKSIWSFLDIDDSFKIIHNSLNTSLLNQDSIYARREIRDRFGIAEDELVLLSLGTVSPRKGQLDFVKALPEIFEKSKKKIKAFIVGMDKNKGDDTQPYSKEIYDIVYSYPKDIQDRIILIPETDKQQFTKPYDFYAMSDIYVFTSRIESFPRVILEALYFGLPIVTTPCFGVIEQCIENYNAFFYKEEDIKVLSLYTLQLINDDNLREDFSKASKRLFEQLQTYDQMIANYYKVIENIEGRKEEKNV